MIAQLSGSAISLSLNQQKLSNRCQLPAASFAASSKVISPTLMFVSVERVVLSHALRWCQLRRDRTGITVVDPRRLRAFALAAEFRPLLRSQGAVHAA